MNHRSVPLFLTSLALVNPTGCKSSESTEEATDNIEAEARSPNNPVRPRRDGDRRRGNGNRDGRDPTSSAEFPEEIRSIDGTDNNLMNAEWGAAEVAFLRLAPAAYEDGIAAPSGADRPNARAISNACAAQSLDVPNAVNASDFVWQWGQFLDHDIDLSPEVTPEERFDIQVPIGDPAFDAARTGSVVMPLHRSLYEVRDGVREQTNEITAYIDASNVYGSDDARAAALRTSDGTGRLATSERNLLPFNTSGLPNAAPPSVPAESLFVAGDFRANEQVGLTVMHTLFVREHNRLADELRATSPELTGDEVYERARAVVAAQMQSSHTESFCRSCSDRTRFRRTAATEPT